LDELPQLSIHPSAIVDERASISADAEIGPFCVIAGEVTIGPHTVLDSHIRVGSRFGRVTIGAHNHILAGAVLGSPAQDRDYRDGAYTALTVGDHNRIGEFVTMHLATEKGAGVTRIGHHNFIMAYSHIAHDCQLGDHIVMANAANLAGHVIVEDHALLSGLLAVTQFVRIGAYSFIAAGSQVNKDIAPYTIAEGRWAGPRASNRVALKRAGVDAAERRAVDRAIRILLDRSLRIEQVVDRIGAECGTGPHVTHLREFLASSTRGIARG
jgi:UDP-N-acetylglucosamine acyltransferase